MMLRWALIFLVVAMVSAFLGFSGIAGAATTIAKVIFYLFALSLVFSLLIVAFNRVRSKR